MAGQIGDITISASGPGHVGMFIAPDVIMHAQNRGGVHTDPLLKVTGGRFDYFTEFAFRPPWEKMTEAARAPKQAALLQIANRMTDRVPYGIWRAIRLFAGSTTFGSGAETRLKKYWERLNLIRGDANTKLVTKVTCVEAVVLTYQLAFYSDRIAPFFIQQDAAHTMPHTLQEWLLRNKWTRVSV